MEAGRQVECRLAGRQIRCRLAGSMQAGGFDAGWRVRCRPTGWQVRCRLACSLLTDWLVGWAQAGWFAVDWLAGRFDVDWLAGWLTGWLAGSVSVRVSGTPPFSSLLCPPLNNHLHQIREWAPIVEGIRVRGWQREKGEAPETRGQGSRLLPNYLSACVCMPWNVVRNERSEGFTTTCTKNRD
jgi:hypothetical protein